MIKEGEKVTSEEQKVFSELKGIKEELQAIKECLEPLKTVCKSFNSEFGAGNFTIPVDSGLTGNEIRELYGLKRVEEALCDKVLISTSLYNSLIQYVEKN